MQPIPTELIGERVRLIPKDGKTALQLAKDAEEADASPRTTEYGDYKKTVQMLKKAGAKE